LNEELTIEPKEITKLSHCRKEKGDCELYDEGLKVRIRLDDPPPTGPNTKFLLKNSNEFLFFHFVFRPFKKIIFLLFIIYRFAQIKNLLP